MSSGPFAGHRPANGTGTSHGALRLRDLKRERVGDAPTKADCPGHVAGVDSIGRWPIGDCGPDCVLRHYRLGTAVWDGQAWRVPNTVKAT